MQLRKDEMDNIARKEKLSKYESLNSKKSESNMIDQTKSNQDL